MSTLDDVITTEQRLRDRADAGNPESWKPEPGGELTGKVITYDKAYTQRGDHAWIMVVESLRNPGRFASVWLLHTALRSKVAEQRPRPGETVFLRYEGLVKPKHGGDEYHGWKLVVDRDESSAPAFGFPWQETPDEPLVPHGTNPPQESGDARPWDEPVPVVEDDIPF